MVYYFTSSTVSPEAFIYVGKDKVESESGNESCNACADGGQMRISSSTVLRRMFGFTSTSCQVLISISG